MNGLAWQVDQRRKLDCDAFKPTFQSQKRTQPFDASDWQRDELWLLLLGFALGGWEMSRQSLRSSLMMMMIAFTAMTAVVKAVVNTVWLVWGPRDTIPAVLFWLDFRFGLWFMIELCDPDARWSRTRFYGYGGDRIIKILLKDKLIPPAPLSPAALGCSS